MSTTIEDYINKVSSANFEELVKVKDPDLESFENYKTMGKEEFDLIYGCWYQRLKDFEPLNHEQKLSLIPWSDIDERLRSIIKRLNELGIYTKFCCQGADCTTFTEFMEYIDNHSAVAAFYPNGDEAEWVEWPNGTHHSQYANISFEDRLPIKLLDIIATESDKLHIEDWGDEIKSTKMKYNSEFHEEFDRILDQWENQES